MWWIIPLILFALVGGGLATYVMLRSRLRYYEHADAETAQ
jgi:hypothetical protein